MAESEQSRPTPGEEEKEREGEEEKRSEELEGEEEQPFSPLPDSAEQVADLLEKVENYTTAIPDSVTESVLSSAGLQSTDPQVTRMVSLVAQKFLSDVAYEALQHCKMRGGGKEMKKVSGRDRKFALTSEDLLVALTDQGIRVKKPPFYAN